jgi:hypothetical protein
MLHLLRPSAAKVRTTEQAELRNGGFRVRNGE